jgi:uncharacterized RDD family membrane protein YckC
MKAGDERRHREVVTPEGVPLSFPLADTGERITALVIDLLILFAALFMLAVLMVIAGADPDGSAGQSFGVIAGFFLRNFYFVFFELRWQGQTPGKRAMKIRVIDAGGGSLTADAIIARNLLRDVELFIPLSVAFGHAWLWPGAPPWARLGAAVWTFIVVLLPLFNRERARVGDLVAGTRVASMPPAVLLPDLAAERVERRRVDARPTFMPEQLDVYGAYELGVLADLLRRNSGTTAELSAAAKVYTSIRARIRWDGPEPFDTLYWLEEFYAAQRAHLERRMLFGQRKADKHDR